MNEHAGEQDKTTEVETPSLPYAARAAMCYMEVEDEGDDAKLYEQLVNALRADSRVDTISAPTQEPGSYDRPVFSAFAVNSDPADGPLGAPDPATHIHAFYFPEPIILEVRVPQRIQPKFEDFKRIPADRYWAAWDGIVLVVLWELEDFKKTGQKTDDLSIDDVLDGLTPSGGMVVQSILADATKKCGNDFIETQCSPVCSYPFAHKGMSVSTVEPYEGAVFEDDESGMFARVILPVFGTSPKEVVEELHRKLAFAARIFAEMRSNGRAASAAARLANRDLRVLLNSNYRRATIESDPMLKTLKERWGNRDWKRVTRRLMARMWLTLATLNGVRQRWDTLKYIYDDAVEDDNIGIIFAGEYKHEVHATSIIDVSEVRAALERITNTMDTRALTLATSIGAVFGAIIGALIGHFI